MDREFTAQIGRHEFGVWLPCGNTTFIVHTPKRERPSLFKDDLLGFRREYRYGAGIVNPSPLIPNIFKGGFTAS